MGNIFSEISVLWKYYASNTELETLVNCILKMHIDIPSSRATVWGEICHTTNVIFLLAILCTRMYLNVDY